MDLTLLAATTATVAATAAVSAGASAASAVAPAAPAAPAPTPTPTPADAASVAEAVTDAVAETTADLLVLAGGTGAGVLAGLAAATTTAFLLRQAGRRRDLWGLVLHHGRTALLTTGGLAGAWVGSQVALVATTAPTWSALASRLLLAAVVLAATWFAAGVLKAVEASITGAVRASGDQGRLNRVTTQTQILRRVIEAVVILCGTVGAAMVFPSARVAMGSLLASAGLVSVIAGLAAQSTLGNVFAGVQLATTDAIRVGDVVVVDTEQGRIEEITLTYVVVHVWDDRRLIYPSTYFTQNPFANWSRRGTQVTGTLMMELDWRVPVPALRARLDAVMEEVRAQQDTALAAGQDPAVAWDGREASLQVTDSVAGAVTVRIVLSGEDPGKVFALKCHVREQLLAWLQAEAPQALPARRVVIEGGQG